ncbi:hypothetical protein VOI54_16540 [Tamlana sp. 2201CG12-4]|uniref:helix-turn-helix transcriptional regulator n=1 Tax=Tamlana sp. 2201CG12-4 TaxID=3112582 RepID=UPI002DB9E254|nr:hypothetical protein [Tamlana sp. 2201CG12-4]MEC3908638.1 hypothetical protein [Tamlana sp. 2201CG12-4]
MKKIKFFLFWIVLTFIINSNAQEVLTSEEALERHKYIEKLIKNIDAEKEPQKYFSMHFNALDLIPLIENNRAYILDFYHHRGYKFRLLDHPQESLNMYKAFFDHYEKSAPYLTPEIKYEYLRKRSFDYRGLALAYEKLGHLDSAVMEHKKNLKFTDHMKTIWKPSAINDYGIFLYGSLKDRDSALLCFKKAYKITERDFPRHFLFGSIRDNIANIYIEQGKLHEAKVLYLDNFTFYQKVPNYMGIDYRILISTGVKLIKVNLELNFLNEAKQIFTKLENLENNEGFRFSSYPESKLKFLQAKELLLSFQNQTKQAYTVSKKVKQLSDSINEADFLMRNTMNSAVNDLVLERFRKNHNLEKAQKESEIKNQKLKSWIITLVFSTVLILMSSLLLWRRQHIINAKSKQLLAEQALEFSALKNEKLSSEIESKKRDLSDFALNLSQSQEWAKSLSKKLSDLKQTTGRARKKMLDDFEQELHNKISFDQNTQEFYNRLDELSHSFYKQLKQDFPKLSKTEVRLCSLIRLMIDSHEIATLQNISLSSLNTSRYRLRKKLNLSKNQNLDDFIQNL